MIKDGLKNSSKVYERKQQTAKELQANRIRVIKEKEEANEVLIVWSQCGQVDILLEHELTLRLEILKRLNDTKKKFIDERKDIQPLSLESVITKYLPAFATVSIDSILAIARVTLVGWCM